VLMPTVPDELLLLRNASRPTDEQVPVDVLLQHQHRRSLLTPELLAAEGFATVVKS
jgi:hypothetical protein